MILSMEMNCVTIRPYLTPSLMILQIPSKGLLYIKLTVCNMQLRTLRITIHLDKISKTLIRLYSQQTFAKNNSPV